MKFKKILIIFLCVALLASFSFSCFATSQESYGFYISPGDYVFDNNLSTDIPFLDLRLSFSSTVAGSLSYFDRISFTVSDNTLLFYRYSTSGEEELVYTFGSSWSPGAQNITVLEGFYIYDINTFQWWQSNVTRVSPGYNSSFFDNMLSIFTAIGQWISGAAANLTSMFFVDNSLTFVGTLSVAALSIAVSFLIISLISRFLRFRA